MRFLFGGGLKIAIYTYENLARVLRADIFAFVVVTERRKLCEMKETKADEISTRRKCEPYKLNVKLSESGEEEPKRKESE